MKYLLGSLSSGYILVASILLICCIRTEKPKKSALVTAFILCAVMSIIISLCSAQETHFYDGIALLVYVARWIIVISAAFGGLRWMYLYTVILMESIFPNFVYIFSKIPEYTGTFPNYCVEATVLILINTVFLILLYKFREQIVFKLRYTITILPRHFYILILLAAFCMCGLTTLNKYSTVYSTNKQYVTNVLLIILTFVMMWMIPSLLINLTSKQHFSSTSELMKNQVEIQLRHYDKLEKLNNEMQSFRHDYINHLRSLQLLIQMNDNNGADAYIEKLLDEKRSTYAMFYTGNRLADAILTDKSDSLPEGFTIEYQGKIPQTLDNVHLCVILTNALDNAIEACGHLSSAGTISITAQEKQGYFVMTVTNPAAENLNFSDIPSTTKSDAEKHGMGLTNIRKVVEEYDGQMRVNCENSIFELSITLKL